MRCGDRAVRAEARRADLEAKVEDAVLTKLEDAAEVGRRKRIGYIIAAYVYVVTIDFNF